MAFEAANDAVTSEQSIAIYTYILYTSEMQSIERAKQTVLMVTGSDHMAPYHFTNCVHCLK